MPDLAERNRSRVAAVDVARGVAVVLMIAAHACDAFLADGWRHNDLWYGVNILFGFVAPAFTFLSGVTLFLAIERRWRRSIAPTSHGDPSRSDISLTDHPHAGHSHANRSQVDHPHLDHPPGEAPHAGTPPSRANLLPIVRRLLLVLLVGYWLQVPNLSLRQLIYEARPAEMARLFDANILQVIAISGLLATALAWLLGSPRRGRYAALAIGAAAIAATPYIQASGIHALLPLPLRYYLAPQPVATFGLFPMLAYFMLGFGLARGLVTAARSWRGLALTVAGGGMLAAAGFLLDPLLHPHPPHNDFWGSSAQHALFRAGGLLTLFGLAAAGARLFEGRRRSLLAMAGRRSLAIYVLHLMLFYGSPVTMGMRGWFGGVFARTLGPLTVIAIGGGTLVSAVLLLRGWERFRRRHPTWARRILWAAWAGFLAIFLLKP